MDSLHNNQFGFLQKKYAYIEDWRNADADVWDKARWINGMEAAHSGVIEKAKQLYAVIGTVPSDIPATKVSAENLTIIQTSTRTS